MINKTCLVFVFGLTLFLILVESAFALNLSATFDARESGLGEEVHLILKADTTGEYINAIEGYVSFPTDLLDFVGTNDANSIISLWIHRPKREEGNRLFFSGIIPGGYRGTDGRVLSLRFRTRKSGIPRVSLTGIRATINDGLGTVTTASSLPASLATTERSHSTTSSQSLIDKDRPESFNPIIASDPEIFGGDYFVSFFTQDKISGIDKYEVAESKSVFTSKIKSWLEVDSPHVLKDQTLRHFVYIKAVDMSGNERIQRIPANLPLWWWLDNWFIFLLPFALLLFLVRKRFV